MGDRAGRTVGIVLWVLAATVAGALGLALHELGSTGPGRPDSASRRPTDPGSAGTRGGSRLSHGAWTVVDHLSAHHVAVIRVETDRLADARQIATVLVGPMRKDYTEVLIYFHRPGQGRGLPARRVQWSPATGFQEIIFDRASGASRAPAPTGRP